MNTITGINRCRHSLLISFLISLYSSVFAQSTDRNYVLTRTYLDSLGTAAVTSIAYHDGLGRVEQIAENGDAMGTFSHTRIYYDQLGREATRWQKVAANSSGTYIPQNELSRMAFSQYSDFRPMTQTEYDALGRVTRISGSGSVWKAAGAAKKYTYRCNASGELTHYSTFPKLTAIGSYAVGELDCAETTSEDGIVSRIYTDVAGRKVAECHSGALTQYVYDEYGRLRYVLTPDFRTVADTASCSYRYTYDAHGRLASKTLPCCAAETYCYDSEGRLCGMQDGRLRADSLWRFFLYDVFGREVVRGTSHSKPIMQKSTVSFGFNQQGLFGSGYVPIPAVLDSPALERVSYYDSYLFTKDGRAARRIVGLLDGLNATPYKNPRRQSMKTGEVIATSDGRHLIRVFLYDDDMRLCAAATLLPDGKYTEERTAYTFTGQPQSTVARIIDGERRFTFVTTNKYDSTGKLASVTLTPPDGAELNVARNTYDRLGRVSRMSRGTGDIDATDYTYNIRGWLTSITNTAFTEHIHYTDGNGTPRYGGDISSVSWQDNDGVTRGYRLSYDDSGRLSSAVYGEGNALLDNVGCYDEEVSEYKLSGCPIRIRRSGLQNDGGFGLIDDLTLHYRDGLLHRVTDTAPSHDYAGAFGFSDHGKPQAGIQTPSSVTGMSETYSPVQGGVTTYPYVPFFTYDSNGAVCNDPYRGIRSTLYDTNGMPRRIDFYNGSFIEYIYALDGTKLRESHGQTSILTLRPDGTPQQTTVSSLKDSVIYIAPWLEYDGVKYRFNVVGGYYSFTYNRKTGEPRPGKLHLYECDHQGNIRAVVRDDGGTLKCVQQTHYYPFGGLIANLGTASGFQRHKYNGKELDRMFGLDYYDYGARQYDPILLRFTSPDPLAEKAYGTSMYAYCKNNPVSRIDPNGMDDYYTKDGEFLYSDDKPTDYILVANMCSMKMRRITGAEWLPLGTPLKNTILSAEAYSKIFTDILSKMLEIDVSKLYKKQVSIVLMKNANDNVGEQYAGSSYNYEPNTVCPNVNATMESYKGKTLLTAYVNIDNENRREYMATISNVQNILGVHEYIGHYLKGWGESLHHLIFRIQKKHHSWKRMTPQLRMNEIDKYGKKKY